MVTMVTKNCYGMTQKAVRNGLFTNKEVLLSKLLIDKRKVTTGRLGE